MIQLKLFGQQFRLPLPLFLLRCAPQKRAPFKSGCKNCTAITTINLGLLFSLISTIVFAQKTVRYDLYVRDTIVTIGNKPKRAIAVNGQIPMPTLTFTEGDIAEIYVHNELKESTSLHWHGLMLPNKEDGVPYVTQMPIEPGTTHQYTFPIIQNGTHWYHSHTEMQEQIGMYGSFIMSKKADDKTVRKGIDDLPTIPIILSEWTDYKPENAHRLLYTTLQIGLP